MEVRPIDFGAHCFGLNTKKEKDVVATDYVQRPSGILERHFSYIKNGDVCDYIARGSDEEEVDVDFASHFEDEFPS